MRLLGPTGVGFSVEGLRGGNSEGLGCLVFRMLIWG